MSAFELGVLVPLSDQENKLAEVSAFGLTTCQLSCWDTRLYTKPIADKIVRQSKDCGVHIAAVWAGWSGKQVWNFIEGPSTLGLVPVPMRQQRVKEIKQAADFAAMIDAPAIITHLGFIPENPTDPIYEDVVKTVADVAKYCDNKGRGFWFESGQETPVTLLRLIEDVNMPNIGINFDTANVVLYGKGNPADAAEIFGKYVRNLHAKDGLYPINGRDLGQEVRLGEGKADFRKIFQTLHKFGFAGEVIIEREISGQQQRDDIKYAQRYLGTLIKELKISA